MAGREDYYERQEAKRERLQSKQAKAEQESENAYKRARSIGERFANGQPILIGHHSEAGARRDRKRVDDSIRKSIEQQEKAEYYENRIKAMDKSNAISSDNPDAIDLLKEKIESLKEEQAEAKEMNKYYKKHNTMVGFPGISEERAKNLDDAIGGPYNAWRRPAPPYILSNLNQKIRAAEQRVQQLEEVEEMQDETIEGDGWSIESDSVTNRVIIRFDEKPDKEIIRKLKSSAFKWAPSTKGWQRLRSPQVLRIAKRLMEVEQ